MTAPAPSGPRWQFEARLTSRPRCGRPPRRPAMGGLQARATAIAPRPRPSASSPLLPWAGWMRITCGWATAWPGRLWDALPLSHVATVISMKALPAMSMVKLGVPRRVSFPSCSVRIIEPSSRVTARAAHQPTDAGPGWSGARPAPCHLGGMRGAWGASTQLPRFMQ
jgi:hypothetical protein